MFSFWAGIATAIIFGFAYFAVAFRTRNRRRMRMMAAGAAVGLLMIIASVAIRMNDKLGFGTDDGGPRVLIP